MVTSDLPFMVYRIGLVVFAASFLSILLQGRHIGPRERFEWDEEIGGYKYVEGSRFHYIGDPMDWFPARKVISYRIKDISIECVVTADRDCIYGVNPMDLFATIGLSLHAMCLEICEAQNRYPERNENPDPITKIEEEYYLLTLVLLYWGLNMESFTVKDGRKVVRSFLS